MITKTSLLGPPKTAGYRPAVAGYYALYVHRKPVWTLGYVELMLSDPRIRFGLRLIKGPLLANLRYEVKCRRQDVGQFIDANLTRFIQNSAMKALRAIEWGYVGHEVLYRVDERNRIAFDTLKYIHPRDVKPLVLADEIASASVQIHGGSRGKVYLNGPKLFWHIHEREYDPYFGCSRLKGTFDPWWDIYSDGGAKDARRLYFYKYLYSGDVLYYPPEDGTTNVEGQSQSNRELALEIVNKRRTGGTLVLPNTVDPDTNQRLWEISAGTSTIPSADIREVIADLKDEEWEGMGIPPEVARAEGTGAFAGRRVPQQAFFSILQELAFWLVTDTDRQIIKPLVNMNFGNVPYEIETLPLLRESETPGEEAVPVEPEEHVQVEAT